MLSCVDDYRKAAQRRLSRLAFDYLEGGAEDGDALRRNRDAYGEWLFQPRVLTDVSACTTATALFGRHAAAPMIDDALMARHQGVDAIVLSNHGGRQLASGVLLGRAPLYGVASRGLPGAAHVLAMLIAEMRTIMQLLGCPRVGRLGRACLAHRTAGPLADAPRSAMETTSAPIVPIAPIACPTR